MNKKVAGSRIVLVDDVITTGSHCHGLCDSIKTAGAVEVTALSLLRVVRE